MTSHHHNSENSVSIRGTLTIKADCRVVCVCLFLFLAQMRLNKRKKHPCLAAITFLSPMEKKKREQKRLAHKEAMNPRATALIHLNNLIINAITSALL